MSEHDLTEFYQEIRPHGPSCSLGTVLDSLEADLRQKADAALADANLPATAIAAVLSRWTGKKITHYTTRRHRNGDCSCG